MIVMNNVIKTGKNNPREKEYIFCPSCTTKLVRKVINKESLLSCPKCGFIFWNNPKPVVSVILEKNGKILLVKRAKEPLKGYWCLPGGYVCYSEKPEDALMREVKEETNLNIRIGKLIGVYQIDNDPRGINLDIIYAGLIVGNELETNEESSEFGFFSIDKLPELIAYKHEVAIQDWKKHEMSS
jgi:ADP-ribose pyrophosphatase YjhB (NUDIX family)